MLIGGWFSSFGDTVFYLAFLNAVSERPFAKTAVLLITISENLPLLTQLLTGVIADFQRNRISKYLSISFIKVILYSLVTVLLFQSDLTLGLVLVICCINLISDSLSYFAGSMLTPIYMRLISDDMTEAMGFRQATNKLVQILGNLSGAFLIGLVSLQHLASFNTATFLVVFLIYLWIRKPLARFEVEEKDIPRITLATTFSHLNSSLQCLWHLQPILRLLVFLSISQATVGLALPLSALILTENPFLTLSTGESLAILSVSFSVGMILGSLTSANLAGKIASKFFVYLQTMATISILVGFFLQNFSIIVMFSFIWAVTCGVMQPRFQKAVFSQIPEDKMGTIQSAIGLVDMLLPSILTMLFMGLAISFGMFWMSMLLGILLLIGFYCVKEMIDFPI